jgi:ATP-dependent helicase/nuclease subunit A
MGETKWTKEQQSAIYTRHCNLLVAAAAGSGKTAVLVERIIKIITNLDNPVDIDRLLVVTFTNAAAAEMRERIGEAISKELDKNPDSKIMQRQLTLLNRSNITTMHSFCLEVIRNNFHHIDLDPNFRISDETEAILLKQEILQELLEDNYEENNESFLALIESFGGSKNDTPVAELIGNLYNFSMSGPWPEKWLIEKAEEFNLEEDFDIGNSYWGKILTESIRIELLSARDKLRQAIEICESAEGLNPYLENIKNDSGLIELLLKELESDFDTLYRSFNAIEFSKLNRVGKDADKDAQEAVKKIRDEVKDKIKAINSEIFNVSPQEAIEALRAMYPIMKVLSELVMEFDRRYKKKKRERGILDFNDLEHLCLKILTNIDDGDIKPSKVALDLREKFEEVLVDEYQDSNNVQETIINMVSRKLTDNPNVFMVGDVKQSIYRFRQAKPELFLDKYDTYSEEEGENSRKITLYKNFRSRKEVINAVNYIFKQLMTKTVGELDYTDREGLNLGADFKIFEEEGSAAGGEVELHIIDRNGQNADTDTIEETEEEEAVPQNDNSSILEEEELDSVQLEARLVAKRIKELINPSEENIYKVYDKDIKDYRPVKFKDIVILMRATSNWAPVFVEELGGEGIPVYADSGTGYFQTVEIRTIMALLQIIDNPMQDIPMISVLRSPIFAFTPEELIDIRMMDREKYFYENIKSLSEGGTEAAITIDKQRYVYEETLKEKADFFMSSINKWREKSIHMPIDEFIWYLYMDTSYYGYAGAMPGGVQRQANLRILFQRARQYEQTSFSGLFNFINFINRLRNSSGDMGSAKILGENEDVVRIMSIHKSKGLEFPVVILASCGKQFNLMDLNRSILFHEEMGYGPDFIDYKRRISFPTIKKQAIKKKFRLESLSEEMRILYVAFTRAKEKLIITGSVANFEKAADRWCYAASQGEENIAPHEVVKGKTYMDWIGMAMAKHRNGDIIRKVAGRAVNITMNDELSTWKLTMWHKNDILGDKNQEYVDKNLDIVDEFSKEKELFIDKTVESGYEEDIKRRLNWQYPYMEASKIPANVSVSELKRAVLDDDNEQNVMSLYKTQNVKKPIFLQEEKGLSPSERGTVVHTVMQHLDLSKVSDIKDIDEQITFLISKEFITPEQAEAVNKYKILNFFISELGRRLLSVFNSTGKVYREVAFYIDLPSTVINKELPEEIYKDEMVRLQGIIDCYFEEEDGNIVLLDYKTDYIGEEVTIEDIKKRYEVQINYYSDTLEKITEKKIKDKFLYLFYNGEIVSM